jgi:hypothetical protein
MGMAVDKALELRHNELSRSRRTRGMRHLPLLFYTLGVLALFLALYFWLTAGSGGGDVASDERWALFVAKWSPTLLILGVAAAVHNMHQDLLERREKGS